MAPPKGPQHADATHVLARAYADKASAGEPGVLRKERVLTALTRMNDRDTIRQATEELAACVAVRRNVLGTAALICTALGAAWNAACCCARPSGTMP